MIRAREKKREGLGDEESGGCFFGKGREEAKAGRMPPFQNASVSFRAQPRCSWRNLVVQGAVQGATVRHVYPFHYTLRIFINANLKNLQGHNIKVGSIN